MACIGEDSYTETPGNLTDLWLSENQRNLVKELAKTVTFDLKADDLAFVGYDGKWVLEERDFKLMVADQSADRHCAETYQWQTANR